MKHKLVLSFLAASILTALNSVQAQGLPVMQENTNNVVELLLFGLAILTLALLAFWLLKNSDDLKNTADVDEHDGREWLASHIKDLEANQLDILIKRGAEQQQANPEELSN